jgi:hypothetical protein
MTKGWHPSHWLLAQDCHFGYGLAISFFVYAVHLPPFWIITLLLAELLFKEALFDQFVEKNPLVWNGFIDFSFYVLGALTGFGIIHLFKGL